jgi:tetratricopeptide (TPR) repeat protein
LSRPRARAAKGDSFDQLQKRLGSATSKNSNVQEPPKEQLNALIKLYKQNRLQKVFNEAQKLTKKYTTSLTLWNLMGASAAQIGQLDDAILAFQKALSIKPDYAEAYNNIGNALKDQDKMKEAIEAYNKALSIKPDYAEPFNNMGNALRDQGRLNEAIKVYKKALSIKPDYAEAYNNMGIALKDQDKMEEAIEAYTKALSIKPDYANACYNMGITLKDQGKLEEAIEAFTKALAIKPDNAEAYNNMGAALTEQRRLEEAVKVYKKALSIKPDNAEAHNNMGIVLRDQGKLKEAIEAYAKSLSIKPDYAEAYNNMGIALKDQGKLEEAIKAYIKALSIKPDYAEAHRNLSPVKKYTENDKQFLQVQKLYKRDGLSGDTRCHLNFALAKMYEDIGKLNQAFRHLSEGNALRKKFLKYSINQDQVLFTKLKNAQPNLLKNKLKINKTSSEVSPIFILGMLRSGTTLVEQIVSSHSEVTGAGELNHVSKFGGKLAVDPRSVSIATVSKFRDEYLADLSKVSNGNHFVTDKMPPNFRFIPLICAAFPEAKIIHVQRNAAATCWSNYKRYFVSNSLGYCYDLKDVVEYYNLYKDLMRFWQSQYGERIYHLNYESLTTDQENETRKLIKYLGLNWQQTCLSPQKNKRSVRTASQQQVRQKVYQGSSEAWRKYEPFLNGAFDSLPSS